jgi:hypothetical protein
MEYIILFVVMRRVGWPSVAFKPMVQNVIMLSVIMVSIVGQAAGTEVKF